MKKRNLALLTAVCVMKDGEICETAETDELYSNPQHEYTKFLLSSIPKIL